MTENIFDNEQVTANSKQLEILKEHFPNCFDKSGSFQLDKFKEIIEQEDLNISQEGYSLNWLGKSYARLLANENPRTLLKPDNEHNDKPENKESQNLLIKGDNIEVLKHLKYAYTGAIKMIYIDPPYNTGSDGFVYQDDRKFTPTELAELANVTIEEAKRILSFTEKGSNSHSAWLTFMYPRLYVARQLLKEDGVIFISIDDNEQAQLKLLCDDVFGEEAFICTFPWKKRTAKSDVPFGISQDYEWILAYANSCFIGGLEFERKYFKSDDYPRDRWRLSDLTNQRSADERKNSAFDMINPKTGERYPFNPNRVWAVTNDTFEDYYSKGKIVFPGDYEFLKISIPAFRVFESEDQLKALKRHGSKTPIKTVSSSLDKCVGMSEDGNKDIINIFNHKIFTYPKPISLIKHLLLMINSKDAIILDFFSGSGTTAHATMDINVQDHGVRQYILVQLPEATEAKSEAYKAGYNTIFDITKARIEKVIDKIKTENPNYKGDLGFKIFETKPLPERYNDEIERLEKSTELFYAKDIVKDDLDAILTTWGLFDNIKLTDNFIPINLDGYEAYFAKETLYLMYPEFGMAQTKALIRKMEDDSSFVVEKIVLFAHNFDSKQQRELEEAMVSFRNKKSVDINVIKRY